jgi:hypothetical protein
MPVLRSLRTGQGLSVLSRETVAPFLSLQGTGYAFTEGLTIRRPSRIWRLGDNISPLLAFTAHAPPVILWR